MTAVGNLIVPEYFFVCQILTWGACDLSETALIYMNKEEAVTYFMIESIIVPFMIPGALLIYTVFSPVYLFLDIIFWMRIIVIVLFTDDGDNY